MIDETNKPAVNWVLARWERLHATERLVLLALAVDADPVEGGGWQSSAMVRELASWSGASIRHTRMTLKFLEGEGIIARTPQPVGAVSKWAYRFGA